MKNTLRILLVLTLISPMTVIGQGKKERTLSASQEQFEAFAKLPENGPIMMVNFLKFKDKIAETGETGKQMYQRYVNAATKFSEQLGAEVLWYGKPIHNLVGPADDIRWDAMFVIKYPSKAKFFQLVQSQDIPNKLRSQALIDYRLIVSTNEGNLFVK